MADYPYLDGPGNRSQGAYAPVVVTPDDEIGGGNLGEFYSGPSEGTTRCDGTEYNKEWKKWNKPAAQPSTERLEKKIASLEARVTALERNQPPTTRGRGRGKKTAMSWEQLNNLA